MQLPDQKYLQALLLNDQQLIEEIYKKYSNMIRYLVVQNGGLEADAEAMFHQALITIYDQAKSNQFELTCSFESLLYEICKCQWLQYRNAEKPGTFTVTNTERFDELSPELRQSVHTMVSTSTRRRMVAEKLAALGKDCEKFLQVSWTLNALPEIAARLGISVADARKSKAECMAKLLSSSGVAAAYNK